MKPIVQRGQNEAEIIRRKLQQHNSRFLTDFSEWCFCMEDHGQILAGFMQFGSWTALPSNIFMWKKNTAAADMAPSCWNK